jgi:hypothetical protein
MLDLHAEPTGKGTTATVTARRPGGEVVACEKFDLAKGKERQRFIEDLRDRLGDDAFHLLDAEAVEADLAAMAADLATPQKAAPPAEVVELGDGRMVRPERFILPDVSGLAVPMGFRRPRPQTPAPDPDPNARPRGRQTSPDRSGSDWGLTPIGT